MKAIDYLKQIKKLDKLIANKMDECDRLSAMATRVNASNEGDRVQTSSSQERMADTIVELIDLRSELDNDIKRYIKLKGDIMQVVDRLENAEYIDLLYKRYFQYMTWEEIAVSMTYTYQWVNILHGRALNKMDVILEGVKGK